MTDPVPAKILRAAAAASGKARLFLTINSTIQSYLGCRTMPYHRWRQMCILLVYALLLIIVDAAAFLAPPALQAVLLGWNFPGAGFLCLASAGKMLLAVALLGTSIGFFAAALLLWFGTGNVIAPAVVWVGASVLAGTRVSAAPAGDDSGALWPWLVGPGLWMAGMLAWLIAPRSPASPTQTPLPVPARICERVPASQALDAVTSHRLRLLLDRALQPTSQFNGFEWRDQFQTAAVRYQVNFMAYALAMAQQRHTPAATAYFAQAQDNLRIKIGDHRMWRYWGLEHAWGNLRLDGDPVRHQNIMYSGFTLLQMALGGQDSLDLHRKGVIRRSYDMRAIMELLAKQYRQTPFGLLACEPNWIYPLCNLITMTGIRAGDRRWGTGHAEMLMPAFLASLDREATRGDGSFIAFRSTLTGLAPPAPGGIVMQAFPCLFLNALSPERAQEHWLRVRQRLDHGSWERLFWPVDVGNYGFSRASSYAATAAAAVEMGDTAIADECLRRLDEACPSLESHGVIHRQRASLWAHALEIMARCGQADGLRGLVERPLQAPSPHLTEVGYRELMVTHAAAKDTGLTLMLHPCEGVRSSRLGFGGLAPGQIYETGLEGQPRLQADHTGQASLHVSLTGPTYLSIKPIF